MATYADGGRADEADGNYPALVAVLMWFRLDITTLGTEEAIADAIRERLKS